MKAIEPAELPSWISVLAGTEREVAKAAPGIVPDTASAIGRATIHLRDCVARGDVAVEGQGGDDRTYQVAADLHDLGISQEMALDLIEEIWNPHCVPPWSRDELATKVRNGFEYAQNEFGCHAAVAPTIAPELIEASRPPSKVATATTFENKAADIQGEIDSSVPGSEDDIAIQYANIRCRELKHVPELKKWYAFNGLRWVEQSTPAVWNDILPLARTCAAQFAAANIQRKIVSKPNVANVEALARGNWKFIVKLEHWDADPWLLNTCGKIIDLRTGKQRDVDATDYCMKSTAVAPVPEGTDLRDV